MSAVKDGGAAFPQLGIKPYPGGGGHITHEGGMTLRDYFAAQAMQGIIARAKREPVGSGEIEWLASVSFKVADAMLRAREAS